MLSWSNSWIYCDDVIGCWIRVGFIYGALVFTHWFSLLLATVYLLLFFVVNYMYYYLTLSYKNSAVIT